MPSQLPEPIRLRRFHWIPWAGLAFGALAGLACGLTDNPFVEIHQTHPSAEGAVFKVELLGVNVVEEAYTVEVPEASRRAEHSGRKERRGRPSFAELEASEQKSREFSSRSRPWIIAISVVLGGFFGLFGWLLAFVADRLIPRGATPGADG